MTQKNNTIDEETILMTLDQLGQTMEVMNHVLAKLRHQFHSNESKETSKPVRAIKKNAPKSRAADQENESLVH